VLEGFPLTVSGTNAEATGEEGEPGRGSFRVRSVWYRWTSPVDGPVVVDTCSGDFDTLLAVYTGDGVGTLTEVAANDDACGADLGVASRVRFDASAGVTYQIAVDGHDDGSFTLNVAPPPAPRPGRYTGRAEFGEGLSFVLSPDGRVISGFTVSRLELDCRAVTLNIRRLVVPPFPVRPDGSFEAVLVGQGGGVRQVARIRGRFRPPARAQVSAAISLSHRAIGKCRYFFGRLRWNARNRG
jgi:hypothetical protein